MELVIFGSGMLSVVANALQDSENQTKGQTKRIQTIPQKSVVQSRKSITYD